MENTFCACIFHCLEWGEGGHILSRVGVVASSLVSSSYIISFVEAYFTYKSSGTGTIFVKLEIDIYHYISI
jgi:hypothetical protein